MSQRAPVKSNEGQRLAALHSYNILDTPPEADFDYVTQMASLVCDTPMALVTFVESRRQWFKSALGLELKETPIAASFCAHAILHNSPFEVADTLLDGRFSQNILVTEKPHVRFYAGAPLLTPDGLAIGMVCVLDTTPRALNSSQLFALSALARQVVARLELRKAVLATDKAMRDAFATTNEQQ